MHYDNKVEATNQWHENINSYIWKSKVIVLIGDKISCGANYCN